MPLDYSGQNLRGRSFKGQNLEEADFSYADIRGTDFTGANLRGANFTSAKAGLKILWKTCLIILSFLFSALTSLVAIISGSYLANLLKTEIVQQYSIIPALVITIIYIAFFLFFNRRFLNNLAIIIATTINIVIAIIAIVSIFMFIINKIKFNKQIITSTVSTVSSSASSINGVTTITPPLSPGFIAFSIFILVVILIAISTIVIISFIFIAIFNFNILEVTSLPKEILSITFFLSFLISNVVSSIVYTSIIFTGLIASSVSTQLINLGKNSASASAFASAMSAKAPSYIWLILEKFLIFLIMVGGFILYEKIKNNKNNIIFKVNRDIIAYCGTNFSLSDLTDANFTEAKLNNTNFKNSLLVNTCFFNSHGLEAASVKNTYLDNISLQELLVTKDGQYKKFNYQDLRYINLKEANLKYASFIGANLSKTNLEKADLSGVRLVQAQLDGTNFTDANLTGAYIENWGISNDTKFDGVRCEYVYMRLPTEEHPDPLRKPDNNKEVFADGEFSDFIKPIVDTLDLYHNQGVDPRAIAISFKKLAENHPDADLRIVGMEVRGEDKFLLRAKTADSANKSELSAEYFTTYNQLKGLPEREIQLLLAEKDSQIRRLENMVMTALERPSFYAQTYNNQGDTMPEAPKKQSTFNLQNAQFAGGLVDAETVNAEQIGGNITNYTPEQKQNLAAAAAEIQQLLNQLDQTYSTKTPLEKQIVVTEALKQIESNPTLKARVIGALKAGGTEALKELLDHPVVNVLLAALDGWQDAE